MAGGDLLYIFAFIILPTAVLVSCIWALILLRKGLLLPARPVVSHDISQQLMTDDADAADANVDAVEETGEHSVVTPPTIREPAVASAVAIASESADSGALVEPVVPEVDPVDRGVVGPTMPSVTVRDEPPPSEQTQEMAALPVDALPGVATDQDLPEATASNPEPPEVHASTVNADPDLSADTSAKPDESAAMEDLLLVPLDEPLPVMLNGTDDLTPSGEPAPVDASERVPPASGSGRRRPARRIVKSSGADHLAVRPRVGQRRGQRGQDE